MIFSVTVLQQQNWLSFNLVPGLGRVPFQKVLKGLIKVMR
jgi:hypothetical protein